MFGDRAERQRRKESESANEKNYPEEQSDEERAVNGKGSLAPGVNSLFRKRTRNREHRNHHKEPAEEHRERERKVPKWTIGGQSRESASVICGSRGVSVEDFRKSMIGGIP